MMKTVKTCGKLYLAGEYAILTAGQPALIKPIPLYMTATIEPAADFRLFSDMFDYAVDLTPDSNYALIQDTISLFADYLGQPLSPFALSIEGKLEKDGKKLGLGSSGSVVLLTLRAMAELYNLSLSADQLFRLAVCVLLKRGDNGSMGDLACIAYEDLIYFKGFDRQQVADWLTSLPLADVLALDWDYEISPLKPALNFDFLVGWTGSPAISSDLVKEVKSAISPEFLTSSQTLVEGLAQALVMGDKEGVKTNLNQLSQLLKKLHLAIYTPALLDLVEATAGLDAVAKSSGAGGGDCGIALSFAPLDRPILPQLWEERGISLIYKEKYRVQNQS